MKQACFILNCDVFPPSSKLPHLPLGPCFSSLERNLCSQPTNYFTFDHLPCLGQEMLGRVQGNRIEKMLKSQLNNY